VDKYGSIAVVILNEAVDPVDESVAMHFGVFCENETELPALFRVHEDKRESRGAPDGARGGRGGAVRPGSLRFLN
jgi:hypothetical protein